MYLKNTGERYGWLAIMLHWTLAVLIVAQYFLGEFIVELDYMHPWYQRAPDLHRSLGVLVGLLLVLRIAWRWLNPRPAVEGKPWEQYLALWVHRSFYLLIAAVLISGYLISTADGQAITVFGWFELPALSDGWPQQEDIAGEFHEFLANGLMVLIVVHSLAALKHHFVDRDNTLKRMLGLLKP